MSVTVIIKKVKSFLLFVLSLWKRALCCFRRRRRSSAFVPLTQIGVVSNEGTEASQDTWGNWNDQVMISSNKPTTVQEHIEYYRQQAIAARQAQDEQAAAEVQENFFDDMAPTITKPKKLYLNDRMEQNSQINKLSLDPQDITVVSDELEEWDEHSGWEEENLDWDTKEALKESRKQARLKKIWEQQQKRQEKFVRPALGAKVPS